MFSKKIKKNFLTPKKWKNGPQKLLIIGPDPFVSQSSPDHSPQPRIDFSYYEISGPDIFSLICGTDPSSEMMYEGLDLNIIFNACDFFASPFKHAISGQVVRVQS